MARAASYFHSTHTDVSSIPNFILFYCQTGKKILTLINQARGPCFGIFFFYFMLFCVEFIDGKKKEIEYKEKGN